MRNREPFDDDLDAAFAALRAQEHGPDAALVGRVLQDARQLADRRRGGWRVWAARLAAAGGVAGTSALGVWIGVAMPGALFGLDAALWGEPMLAALGDPALLLAE